MLSDSKSTPREVDTAQSRCADTPPPAGDETTENTKGVVLELGSDMEGLALTLGVVVQWESDYQSGLQNVQDGTKKAWEGTKKAAARRSMP